eukprot:187722-Pleurochrysis_carterae.AAC.1
MPFGPSGSGETRRRCRRATGCRWRRRWSWRTAAAIPTGGTHAGSDSSDRVGVVAADAGALLKTYPRYGYLTHTTR